MDIIHLVIIKAGSKERVNITEAIQGNLFGEGDTLVLIARSGARGYIASIKTDGEQAKEKDFTTLEEAVEYIKDAGYIV